jgi:seryl-tRNA synthetase
VCICSWCTDFRERILKENLKDDRKKGSLTRMGSISSEQADKGDPTKKRRVERSRKMAEAKERSSTPVIPSDIQVVLKRCETLEKEVRSLKLNLSFMNRKDSEQTKQIEELQKQNEDLVEEKERLLEEIERIVSDTNT